jgi:hypothetical protein
MLTQVALFQAGLGVKGGSGDCLLTPAPSVIAADANDTLTVDKIHAGVVQYTGFSAGRTVTTDTAAAIIAAFPDLDIGDSFIIIVSTQNAFAITWAAGAGVTLSGRATTPASTFSVIVVTKTGAATIGWRVL